MRIKPWQLLVFVPLQAILASAFAQEPKPTPPPPPEERIAACQIDFLVQLPSGQRCYLGLNRIGPFCPAQTQAAARDLQRCSKAQLEASLKSDGAGRTITLSLGLAYRLAEEGVRE